MNEVSGTAWLWLARGGGAIAGSAISLAYMLPQGRREAATRLAVGLVSGLVFGAAAGVKIAVALGIERLLGPFEILLIGSAAASLLAWWALGLALRVMTGAAEGSRHAR